MEQEPKKDNSEEDLKELEELEELKKVIKKIEKLQKEKQEQPRQRLIAIEFGGVFHHNRYINLVFNFILNFTFAFFVIELFNFANYKDIIYVAALMLVYSVFEELYKTYILMRQFPLVLKSFGTIFFFGYLLIFYILDQYVFVRTFNFVNGTLLAFFVLIFTLTRYLFSQLLRNYFRSRNMG